MRIRRDHVQAPVINESPNTTCIEEEDVQGLEVSLYVL